LLSNDRSVALKDVLRRYSVFRPNAFSRLGRDARRRVASERAFVGGCIWPISAACERPDIDLKGSGRTGLQGLPASGYPDFSDRLIDAPKASLQDHARGPGKRQRARLKRVGR
jgi:hypothetical protein